MNREEFLKNARIKRPECSESALLSDWEAYRNQVFQEIDKANRPFYNKVYLVKSNLDQGKMLTLVKISDESYYNMEDPEADTGRVKATFMSLATFNNSDSKQISLARDVNIYVDRLKDYQELNPNVWDQWQRAWGKLVILSDDGLYRIDAL